MMSASDYYYTPTNEKCGTTNNNEYFIHEQPGYYYNWIAPLQQWGLKWKPIRGIYCPPQWDTSVQWTHLAIPEGVNILPLLGDGDMHIQKVAEDARATYIYYRQDRKKSEIWAQDITEAITKINIYLKKIQEQQKHNKNKQQKFFKSKI